jgi:hypothetical protein
LTTEFELADSLTGERLGACVIRIRGNYLDTNPEKDIYDQPRRALKCTASFLRFLMDRAHGELPDTMSDESGQAA